MSKKITRDMVINEARKSGLRVRREGQQPWQWYNSKNKQWYLLASTNVGAMREFENLANMERDLFELEEKFNQPNT